MIGIFGNYTNGEVSQSQAFDTYRAFLSAINQSKFDLKFVPNPRGMLGLCRHLKSPKGNVCSDRSTGISVAFCGEILNIQHLTSCCEIPATNDPAYLLLLMYKYKKLRYLEKVNGLFCASIFDNQSKSLHLITDRYASFPLHYYKGQKNFVFACSIYQLLNEGTVPRQVCEKGLSQLFTLQRTLGSYTNVKNVKAMPAGSILTLANSSLSLAKYWSLSWKNSGYSDIEISRQFLEAIQVAVETQTSLASENTGLLLSGGVDSRLILGSDHSGRLSSWTVASYETNPELNIARQAADMIGSEFHPIIVNPEKILEWQEEATIDNNGLYPASTQYSCFVDEAADHCDVLLTGHGLDYTFRGYYLPASFLSIANSRTRLPKIRRLPDTITGSVVLNNLRQGPPRSVLNEIIKPSKFCWWWQEMESSFDTVLAPWINSEEPINAWDAFILGQVSQHYAFSGMMAIRAASNLRIPAFDNRVFEIYLGMTPKQRILGASIYRALSLISADLAHLKNANTGFPANLGPWNEIIAQLMRGAFRRLRILRRENLPSSSHSQGSWQNLGNLYRDDPSHIDRLRGIRERLDYLSFNLLDPDVLAKCIDDHISGEKMHTKLLRQLITHDSWARNYKIV